MILVRFLIALALTTCGLGCAVADEASDPYAGYSAREAAFLKDAEFLLFGNDKSVYPLGGDLEVSNAIAIDGVCYSAYFRWGIALRFANNFWNVGYGYADPPCDQASFFSGAFKGKPYRPTTSLRPVYGVKPYPSGGVLRRISRRSRLFVNVTRHHKSQPDWAAYQIKRGYFGQQSACRMFARRDEFGSFNVFLSFARSGGGTASHVGIANWAGRQKVTVPLANNAAFLQCLMRGFAFARGIEGVADVPAPFLHFASARPRVMRERPQGCEFGQPGSLDEVSCLVPDEKVGNLSILILLALDAVPPERDTYTPEEFRAWIKQVCPPGGGALNYEINRLIPFK